MGDLKEHQAYLRKNNEFLPEYNRGRYDNALERSRILFKYFLRDVPERVEAA